MAGDKLPARTGLRLAIDTGGTFTDVILADEGELRLEKALTTAERPFGGIEEALVSHGQAREQTTRELLSEVDVLIYGTTASTNAIVTGTVARTALITTAGFGDTLALREGGTPNAFDFSRPYPGPYVPRRLTFEVAERVSSDGIITVPLDEEEARCTIERLRREEVEAVAVCLLWSILEPTHELRLGALVEELLPGVPCTLSHRLNPIIREYRRMSGTAIDASLKPLMQRHFRALEQDLRTAGFDGQMFVVTSVGGVQAVAEIAEQPIYSVDSGPAMAPVGALKYIGDSAQAVVADVGGTTFDVSVVRDGEPAMTRDRWFGPRYDGDITGLGAVDVRSIGAGGGSIAHVDAGGLLCVGPQSAGASPGPACYGLGGEHPTVTDAAVVLGYIDPAYFLGGAMEIDLEAARRAIAVHVAEPLRLDVERAAHSVISLANLQMASHLSEFVMQHGMDPRATTIVAAGGAGGLVAADLASRLGSREVVVPRTAAALSACGGLFSDVVREFSVSRFATTEHPDFDHVNAALEELDAVGAAFLSRVDELAVATHRRHLVEARYPSQSWEIDVPLPAPRFNGPADVEALHAEFEREHERLFAVTQPGMGVEFINWKVRCTAELPSPEVPLFGGAGSDVATGRRIGECYFGEGFVPTRRYRPGELRPGQKVPGPAVIDEPTTVVLVPRDWELEVMTTACYRMRGGGSE